MKKNITAAKSFLQGAGVKPDKIPADMRAFIKSAYGVTPTDLKGHKSITKSSSKTAASAISASLRHIAEAKQYIYTDGRKAKTYIMRAKHALKKAYEAI